MTEHATTRRTDAQRKTGGSQRDYVLQVPSSTDCSRLPGSAAGLRIPSPDHARTRSALRPVSSTRISLSPRASRRSPRAPILSVIAGNVLFGTGLIFHAFLYNFYLEALHFSADVMGDAAAALAAGGLVTLLPAGAFTDRAGPRAAVATAAVVLATGLALGAVAATPVAVYAAAAVAGAGSGIWRVAMPPVLMALTESGTRARAFAWNVGMLVVWGGLGTAMAGATSEWLEGGGGFQHTAALRGALLLGAVGSAASLVVFRRLRVPAEG